MIIVDEFQDTDDNQWRIVRALSEVTDVFCLADPEQRIFDYRDDIDPHRLDILREAILITEFDLGGDNHRSPNAGILQFADAVLRNQRPLSATPDVKQVSYWATRSRRQYTRAGPGEPGADASSDCRLLQAGGRRRANDKAAENARKYEEAAAKVAKGEEPRIKPAKALIRRPQGWCCAHGDPVADCSYAGASDLVRRILEQERLIAAERECPERLYPDEYAQGQGQGV